MIKSRNLLRLAQNYSFSIIKSSSFAFSKIMEEAIADRKDQKQEKHVEKTNKKKERYNGKVRRREWQEESEEAKRARMENPVERVKRKKSLILMGYSGVNYSGMQRNPGCKTIEDELFRAMLKNDWITEEANKTPQQAFFQRASRTDKGVSAARQVVSLKLPEGIDASSVEIINKDLPEDIKIFAVRKVTKGFNAKTTCDSRSYSYTLPTYTFTKDDETYDDKSFRLSSERFEELNKVLSLYVGSKCYHNFTIKKEAHDPSTRRVMMSFECEKPFIPDNTEIEFARLRVQGQSFMLHQIRKMVGSVIAIMRGYKEVGFINEAMQKEKIITPQAPGLGLVLDNVHYEKYNERYGADGVHEALTFEKEDDAVEEFFRKYIMSTIIETELKEESMLRWIGRLKNHSYDPNDYKQMNEEKEEGDDGNESDE